MRPWNRRERERAAKYLMARGFVEIRNAAFNARNEEDPSSKLAWIMELADICHDLPSVIGKPPPRPGDFDPFTGPWHSPNPDLHAWMTWVLTDAGLDTAWLDAVPLIPPHFPPAEHPRLARGGIRFPRSLREYTVVDTATLRTLVNDAHTLGWPDKQTPDAVLAHFAPDGRHLLRAVRRGESYFGSRGEGLAEYRCLQQMIDGAIVTGHFWLRPAAFEAVPRGLSPGRQLWLAASVKQQHEQDDYLWRRAHRATSPDCPLCPAVPPQDGSASSGS
jgi:hypothetical protein